MDRTCSETHLAMIANDLTDWELLAYGLGLSDAEVEEVDRTYRALPLKRVKMLLKWKKKYKEKATYERLAKAFCSHLSRNDMADRVRQVLATPSCDSGISSPFAEHLKIWYTHNDPNDGVWPPIERGKFCSRGMVKIEIQSNSATLRFNVPTSNNTDSVTKKRVPVELENIFAEDCSKKKMKRKKVILIEGAPGSGKSTLLWYMCEKWASGELFQEFHLVIYIRLREYNTTQSLCSMADILPCSSDMKESAWDEIKAANGKGVLFLLDGWDELPQSMQTNSTFKDIIKSSPKYPLLLSTVVVTSRYVSSDELLRLATSHLEILGFTDREVKECILYTSNNEKATDALMAALESRPSLLSSCYLPLNVIIISYLYEVKGANLPVTLLGTFKLLILHCIQRHVRNKEPDKDHDDIISLESLPQELHNSFNSLCELAFNGLMQDRMIFTRDELGSIPDHLSLLHGAKVYEETGPKMIYSFFHHTIQELLAAMHMSKVAPDEQLDYFRKLFGQQRFDAMIQFYAGITSLQLVGIKSILVDIILYSAVLQHSDELECNPKARNCVQNMQSADDLNGNGCEKISSRFEPGGSNELTQINSSDADELKKMMMIVCKEAMANDAFIAGIAKVSNE